VWRKINNTYRIFTEKSEAERQSARHIQGWKMINGVSGKRDVVSPYVSGGGTFPYTRSSNQTYELRVSTTSGGNLTSLERT
jgi:hypothetical protein